MDWGKVYFSKRHQICISCEPVHQLTQPEIQFPIRCAVNVLKQKMEWCHSISIRFLVIYQQNTQRCYCFDPGVFSVSTIGTNVAKFSPIWFHPTTLNRDERKTCRGNRTRTSCIALFIMTKPFGCICPSNWLLLVTDAFINAKNCIFQAQ